jgi:hypothetical protein
MFSFNNKKTLTNEEKVLECINNTIEDSEIQGKNVFLPKYDLRIEPYVRNINENGNAKMVELLFVVKHKFFNEPFIESNAGIGINIEDAINQSVANFSLGALSGIRNCIDSEYSGNFETDFFGQRKSWSLTESCVQGIGEKEKEEHPHFWSMIGEQIKIRLGNKKMYWVKVYAAKLSNGEVSCECSINGVLNNEITKDIEKYAKTWNIKTDLCSLKQFFIIKQDDETFNKYPFSENQVKEFTDKAIKILADCNCKEKHENLDNDIFKITGNMNLAYEIRSFIPEILCELVFSDASYTDKIVIVKENEEENTECYKNQFTSYNWIHDIVANNYNNSSLTEDKVKTIVYLSASYNALNNAIKQGAKIEDLKNVGVGLRPIEVYIPS